MTEQPISYDTHHVSIFTASDVPEEIQQELASLADMGEARSWGVARLTEVLFRGLAATRTNVQKKDVYAAIAQHARSSGESVRMWHRTYLAVPNDIRIEYQDRLSFHQFKAVVPHAKTPAEWADVLNRWLDYAANSNHNPGSVDGLRAWLLDQKGAPPPEVGRHQRIGRSVRFMLEDEKVPAEIKKPLRKLVDEIEKVAFMLGNADWSWEGIFSGPHELPSDQEEI